MHKSSRINCVKVCELKDEILMTEQHILKDLSNRLEILPKKYIKAIRDG